MSPEHRYRRHFIVGILAYVGLLLLSRTLLNTPTDSLLDTLIALLPVLPVAYIIVMFMRYLRQLDEMLQRIQMEAFAFSLGMTGLLTFILGFLENAGFPRLSMVWVLPLMIALWWVGQWLARRRY